MNLDSIQPYQPPRNSVTLSDFVWLAFMVPKSDLLSVIYLDSSVFPFILISSKTEKTLYKGNNLEELVDY